MGATPRYFLHIRRLHRSSEAESPYWVSKQRSVNFRTIRTFVSPPPTYPYLKARPHPELCLDCHQSHLLRRNRRFMPSSSIICGNWLPICPSSSPIPLKYHPLSFLHPCILFLKPPTPIINPISLPNPPFNWSYFVSASWHSSVSAP